MRFINPSRLFTNHGLLDLDLFRIKSNSECEVFLRQNANTSDQPLYIIRQDGAGRGMFSLVLSVVCHIHYAKQYGLLPIVDFTAANSEYADHDFMQVDLLNRCNPWDFYFEPVSPALYNSDFSSKTVLESTYAFPRRYPHWISRISDLREITKDYIRLAADLVDEMQKARDFVFQGQRVLGVHFRGKEMRVAPLHPLPPTTDQMFEAIERAVREYDFDRIFVVSEDSELVSVILKRFPGMGVTLPQFRTSSGINSYRINPRPMHKYLLGKEILIDALVLSECQGLIGSISNVTEFARCYNKVGYDIDLVIDNGLNSSRPLFAKHLWQLKASLPARWGGFLVIQSSLFLVMSKDRECE